ncbi:MAG: helicase, partial [Pseudomonadota bacterium]
LHARLTERFVNRRTTILMKSLGQDAAALPVTLEADGQMTVEGEAIGRLDGFRFVVDPNATLADRKMLLAAGEKALPGILTQRANWLLGEGLAELEIGKGAIRWQDRALAEITMPDDFGTPRLTLAREVSLLPEGPRAQLEAGLTRWLAERLEPLAPLRKLAEAARDPEAGSLARALLITLIDARGVVSREKAGLEHLPKEMRPFLRKIGVTFGALDIFARDMLKPAPRQLLHALGLDTQALEPAMLPVLAEPNRLPAGYRPAGTQAIRVDLAEKVLRAAFDARSAANDAAKAPAKDETRERKRRSPRFRIDLALAVSIGLEADNAARLLGSAGFRLQRARKLAEGAQGPAAPDFWTWRPRRADENPRQRGGANEKGRSKNAKAQRGAQKGPKRNQKPQTRPSDKPDTGPARAGGAFDALADLLGK